MAKTTVRIGIVGMGHVGPHAASCLIQQGIADEIYVCDVAEKEDKLQAEMLDLYDSALFAPRQVRIYNCHDEYEKLASCEVIINAAGHVHMSAESRDGELFATVASTRSFVGRIAAAGFEGYWVDVSNPNDVVTREIQRLSGLPTSHVLGTGTLLDSARLRAVLSRATGLSSQSIDAYMLGEHGFTEMAAWSQITIAGKPLAELAEQNPERFKLDPEQMEKDAKMGGYYVYQGKQCTEYAIGASAARLAEAIVHDERVVLAASVYLEGQYGQSGFYISTPAVIGGNGVEAVIELTLTDAERKGFLASCAAVQANYAKLPAFSIEDSRKVPAVPPLQA
jgi:L-lactate dehydrogenase